LDKRLGLGHVALLPLITLLLIYAAWRVLRPTARAPLGDVESTRLAAAGSAPLEEGKSPSRRLQWAYGVVLAITLLLFLAQAPVRPVIVTEYVYRALAAPFLLGMLVPALTLFSYLSLRLRVPVIALGIAVFSLLVATHSELNDVRRISSSARRPTLEDSVNRWAAVNGCDWRSNADACPSPIIVSAAGGASRAAFLTASVIGKLMDETDLPRPFGKQVFAISGVSGGSLGAVITYAALADSQIREKAINGLGAPPCDRNAHDSEWFRSDPAWGWLADTKPSSASQNDRAAEVQPVTSPDTKWRECLQRILAGDFLSPVVVSLISNDLLGFSLLGDRATILENAWELRYADQTGQLVDYEKEASTLQGSMVDLRQRVLADANNWLPVLLLNGTSVTTGRRIVTTDIDTLLARTPLTDPSSAGGPSIGTPVSRSSSRLFRDAYDLHELFEIQTPIRGFSSGRFSPDGRTFLTVLGDKVQFWEIETGNELRPITIAAREEPRAAFKIAVTGEAAKQKSVRHTAFNATGKLLLIADGDGVVSVWDFANRRQLWDSSSEEGGDSTIASGPGEASPNSAQFSPDGERVLTKHGNRMVHLWNAATGQKLKSFTSSPGISIEAAAFTPDGVRVMTSDKSGLRQLWNVETSAKLLDLKGGSPDSGAAVFSADGGRVLTVPLFNADNKNWDGKAVLWDTASGAPLKTLQHEVSEPFVDYGFSPDGHVILTSTASALVLWFDDGTSVSIQSEFRAQSGLRGATFSSDGKHLLLVDGVTAELWEIQDGAIQKRRIFKGEESWVSGAAFSGNDERILTWSDNGMAIVWDTDTGIEVRIVSVSRSTMARCEKCDIRLSTAATMSARFPIISPHGNIRNTEKQIVDRVVDGGYYENFGATTALELAAELEHFGLKPSIILINNEPATSGMNCISASNRLTYPHPSQTMSFPLVQSPIFTVMGTRSARGSHAAVELCSAIGEQKFAFVTVAPDSRNPGKELSMSWWLSKYVQNYLDDQLSDSSANTGSFNAIKQWRSH
jgi:WD40 repeat protein